MEMLPASTAIARLTGATQKQVRHSNNTFVCIYVFNFPSKRYSIIVRIKCYFKRSSALYRILTLVM